MICATNEIVSAMKKKNQKTGLKFAYWLKLFFFFLILEKYRIPDFSVLTLAAWLYTVNLF